MCICEPIHVIAARRHKAWADKTVPLEVRVAQCLKLYEEELRKDAEIFERVDR